MSHVPTTRPHEDVLDANGEIAGWSRRAFLRLMGASVALGGAAACERPKDKIVPYVRQPEDVVPGIASSYATSMEHAGLAFGLLVESHEGRPTKVEGNPRHPASLGATDTFSQASVLSLYDPDRAKAVSERGVPRSFDAFTGTFVRAARERRGAGLFVVLEPTSSPLVLASLAMLRTELPGARVLFASAETPLARARWEGARAAFGRVVETQLDVSGAEVVASFGMDLLAARPETVHLARNVSERRRVRGRSGEMARLWVAETAMSVTGATSDHRLALRPSEMVPALASLLAELARSGADGIPATFRSRLASLPVATAAGSWGAALAKDLRAHGPSALVVCGDDVPWEGHLLAHAARAALGTKGVRCTRSPIVEAGEETHGLASLARAIDAGAVSSLLVLGGNPVFTAPADLELPRRLRQVPRSAYLGAYADETAVACAWHVAEAHSLESWGDLRAFDGTLSFVQPLIAPMQGGRTRVELLAALAGDRAPDAHRMLRAYHAAHGLTSDEDWEGALALGQVDGTAFAAEEVAIDWARVAEVAEHASGRALTAGAIELSLVMDVKVGDGRHAGNAWLQELPDPITKLTWGNALLLSPRTAKELAMETGHVAELTSAGRKLDVPVLVSPGHADGAGTIALGYGRTDGLTVGARIGVDAYVLRTTSTLGSAALTAQIRSTSRVERLAVTMAPIDGGKRGIARSLTLAQHREPKPTSPKEAKRSLYFRAPLGAQQWAMAIDLTACTGCSACVVACQAENNVPVVGKEGVLAGREMHWLRIDRYVEDGDGRPRIEMMPMLCQHCEAAPCEYVCPVGATTHSSDGLNQMTYPRCVGTRFCSNNCPYKVRRFNWFDYNRDTPALRALAHNPDVTVRARGVMEKCTYCVQRIREAERKARVEHRPLRTGDVVTACQQACPTRAIHFGSLTDPRSEVVSLRADDRTYSVLEDLGTRPRTTYLARLRNPVPGEDPSGGGGR
jgi:Fe-S-cluster-containing dehydrogenase component